LQAQAAVSAVNSRCSVNHQRPIAFSAGAGL